MNLGRFFQRLGMYRLARQVPTWVLIALAVGFYLLAGIGKAQAQAPGCTSAAENCTLEQAAAACVAHRQGMLDYYTTNVPSQGWHVEDLAPNLNCDYVPGSNTISFRLHDQMRHCCGGGQINGASKYYTSGTCAAPDVWNNTMGKCITQEYCLSQPALGPGKVTGGTGTACSGGCVFDVQNSSDAVMVGIGDPPVWIVTGHKPTGAACSTDDYTPNPEGKQDCTAAGANQTFCVKADGKHCYSASTGRQICWRPGETGEKTDQHVAQTRDGGTTPATPTNPDTTQSGDPVTTTTTKGPDGITVVTTTTNFTTNDGTDAGGDNQGEPGDGTGSGSGDGDGSGITADSIRAEAETLDQGEGGEGVDGTTAWGADEGGEFVPDEGGFGLTRTCPAPPEVMGQVLDFSGLCTIMQYVGLLILAAAHMHALYIIAGD